MKSALKEEPWSTAFASNSLATMWETSGFFCRGNLQMFLLLATSKYGFKTKVFQTTLVSKGTSWSEISFVWFFHWLGRGRKTKWHHPPVPPLLATERKQSQEKHARLAREDQENHFQINPFFLWFNFFSTHLFLKSCRRPSATNKKLLWEKLVYFILCYFQKR